MHLKEVLIIVMILRFRTDGSGQINSLDPDLVAI